MYNDDRFTTALTTIRKEYKVTVADFKKIIEKGETNWLPITNEWSKIAKRTGENPILLLNFEGDEEPLFKFINCLQKSNKVREQFKSSASRSCFNCRCTCTTMCLYCLKTSTTNFDWRLEHRGGGVYMPVKSDTFTVGEEYNENRFLAHSCSPNLQAVRLYERSLEGQVSADYNPIIFIAKCNIPADDKLTIDYAPEDKGNLVDYSTTGMKCQCGMS